jgi:transposase
MSPLGRASGRTNRHRLNRGGDRQANHALRTRLYVARRTAEGMSRTDIFRCLKRFIAREVYKYLTSTNVPQNNSSRPLDDL